MTHECLFVWDSDIQEYVCMKCPKVLQNLVVIDDVHKCSSSGCSKVATSYYTNQDGLMVYLCSLHFTEYWENRRKLMNLEIDKENG